MEGLYVVGVCEVIVLSLNVGLLFNILIGQCVSLQVSFLDGFSVSFLGLVNEVVKFGSEGGFVCYWLWLVLWIWFFS